MGGSLMQLAAYGAQDVYLTGNPQMTYFKVVYRRHTNFSMETIEQTYNGSAKMGKRYTVTLARNGDLVSGIWLEMDLVARNSGTEIDEANGGSNFGSGSNITGLRVGHKIIDYAEVEIGGQLMDKQYGDWMDLWTQLTYDGQKWEKLERMLTGITTVDGVVHNDINQRVKEKKKVYVPLQFWFCRNIGLALPLIALQYHEVKIHIQLLDVDSFIGNENEAPDTNVQNVELEDIKIWADYIYLDTDERRRFAQVSHEYLIEQVQSGGTQSLLKGSNEQELRFNHPVKELMWTMKSEDSKGYNYFRASDIDKDPEYNNDMLEDIVLILNGSDRFSRRTGNYFRTVSLYQHHTGGDKQFPGNGSHKNGQIYWNNANKDKMPTDIKQSEMGGIYCYSFAIKPENHQPSGTCNFSRIDNAAIMFNSSKKGTFSVYAMNYNVLRVMSGMGGLAYSN